MSKSLIKNSLFYLINNLLNMLFPFLTSIYVARILPPVAIGEIAYAQNIVSYFAILAFLGLPTYGMREISKARNDSDELSKLFSELFIINFISTIVFSGIYYGLILLIPDFREHLFLYAVSGLMIILNMLNISWLYEGLEEFRYVSIRNAVFKVLVFGLLLMIVRAPDDAIPYVAITVLGVAGNNVVNVIHARKYVKLRLRGLGLGRHMKSIFMLVVVNLAIEIYSLLGTSMLGLFGTKENVAYYSYASKVNSVLIRITNTITMVLVPRIALYYGEGQMEAFNALLTKALKILVMISVPLIVGMQFTSEQAFCLLFGEAYIRSAYVEKILCWIILIAPVGYLLGSRVMLVSGNESKMAFCVGAGAVANALANFFLVRLYGEIGTALAAVIGAIMVAVFYVNFGRRIFRLSSLKDNFFNIGIASFGMVLYLVLIDCWNGDGWLLFLAEVVGAALVYVVVLFVLKDSIFYEYGKRLISRI